MLYFDYTWDLHPNGILLDEELDINKLGWKEGDHFKVIVGPTGRAQLAKVDPLVAFAAGYSNEKNEVKES